MPVAKGMRRLQTAHQVRPQARIDWLRRSVGSAPSLLISDRVSATIVSIRTSRKLQALWQPLEHSRLKSECCSLNPKPKLCTLNPIEPFKEPFKGTL